MYIESTTTASTETNTCYPSPPPTSKVFGDISTTLSTDIGVSKDSMSKINNNSFSVTWCSVLQGEYDPRTCINDIFNGGCGMKNKTIAATPDVNSLRRDDNSSRLQSSIKSAVKGAVTGSKTKPGSSYSKHGMDSDDDSDSFEPARRRHSSRASGNNDSHETSLVHARGLLLSEEEVRDDLRFWRIDNIKV